MKSKISVTLSQDLLEQVGQQAQPHESRSQTVERLLRCAISAEVRAESELKDLEILQEHIKTLSEEALDVLEYLREEG